MALGLIRHARSGGERRNSSVPAKPHAAEKSTATDGEDSASVGADGTIKAEDEDAAVSIDASGTVSITDK